MKPFRSYLVAVALLLFCAVSPSAAVAQLQTGNLYGTVVDEQGQPLPGVTVTVTGQGDPQVQVTNAQGQFRFLGLPPGQRQLKTELEGFSTVDYPNLAINVGRNTDIEVTLSAAVEDVITVTGGPMVEPEQTPTARDPWVILQQTPGVLMDRINVGGNEAGQQSQFTGQQDSREFTMEDFANLFTGDNNFQPSGGGTWTHKGLTGGEREVRATWAQTPSGSSDKPAWVATPRDPWAILQTTPGVLTDRINIGGNEAGQQSQYLGPGAAGDQSVWSVDGVVITDMAALGSSPAYYDFDSFEEMQVSTGGTDATIATGGVVLNMVTKRGTNEWRGSGRYLISDQDWNAAEQQGNRIVSPQDYGAELGGPIIKDRLWLWGSYGTQEVDLLTIADVADFTELETYNTKLNAQITPSSSAVSSYFQTLFDHGYTRACNVPGFNVFTTPGTDCGPIRSSLQNLYGSGAFRGFLPDPFAGSTIHIGVGEPPTGRVGNIAVDPTDPSGNTVYSTGTTGGTWKTTNFLTRDPNGPTWVPVTIPAGGAPQPLFVVNGEPLTEVADIDPSSIENIEILKGSAATALYGSRGANGVVVVTTKAAPKIEDTHIFNSNFYLTGMYSLVNGGFQLVPGTQAAPVVHLGGFDQYDYAAAITPLYVPDAPFVNRLYGESSFATFAIGGKWRWTEPDNPLGVGMIPIYRFYAFDREDFTLCPNGTSVGAWNAGTPVDLGNGSSFVPFLPVQTQELCEDEEPKEEEPSDELITGVEHALLPEFVVGLNLTYRRINEILEQEALQFETAQLNPEFLNGLPGIPSNQNFGARFRYIYSQAMGQQGPGGSVETFTPAALPEGTSVLLVSLGESTGEAFRAHVLSDRPVSIEGMAALEPVAAPPEQVARFEQMMKEAGAVTATIEAYCTQFDGLVPPAGTAYRFAPPEVQKAFEPLARVLDAGQRVKDAGGLVPDTQLDTYFPAISQWAVWTREKGFDLESFGEAWLGHVKKNVEQAGERMTDELEQAVRERIPGRWRDIEKILAEADRI